MRTFVIAEAGISHDGDITKALKLIDVAREARADAVKFQTFNASALCKRRGKPELDLILKPYEMPLTWLPQLKKHCDDVGIEFMTTCFDEETVKIAAPFLRRFKIGHGEHMDRKFIEAHTALEKEVIISVPVGVGVQVYHSRPDAYLMKILLVNTSYPTPLDKVGLSRINAYEYDGFSDHTRHVMMGALAVAAGAEIVEVHFCHWETNWDNLDRPVSHDPSSLIKYVELVREAELAVYGEDKEETKRIEHPGSSPRISRPLVEGGSGPSVYPPGVAS